MNFGRKDYNANLSACIAENEPVFLIRAKDVLALPTLLYYRTLLHDSPERDGKDSDRKDLIDSIEAHISRFRAFMQGFPERLKYPDVLHKDITGAELLPPVSGRIEQLESELGEANELILALRSINKQSQLALDSVETHMKVLEKENEELLKRVAELSGTII